MTIVTIYAPSIGAPQYIRQTLIDIKEVIDSNTIIGGDSWSGQITRTINKETQVLNGTSDGMDLVDIFRTSHPNAEEYTFSSAHGTFSRVDHILGHK